MSSEGIETLKLVARRSLWIVVILTLLGAALMSAVRQWQGPQFKATSRVVLSPTDLASALAGFQGFVDPDVVDETETALAGSRQLFARVASRTGGSIGSASELREETDVAKNDATLAFTVRGEDERRVVATANAIATDYPGWRADVSGASIERAINQVEAQLGSGAQREPSLVDELNRLKVLRTLTSGNVLLVERARSAEKTRPRPVQDALLGAFIGLFVALLVIAAREAIDTRVRSESEVEDLLNVPVIGTIEALPRRAKLVSAGRRHKRYGDMYAILAANLERVKHSGARLIAVTSATAWEGKTTTASNLAAALTRRNADVVLVDLDRRKPTLAKLFKIPPTAPGIDEVIGREVTPEGALWTVSLNGQAVSASSNPASAEVQADGDEPPTGTLRVLPMRPVSRDGGAHRSGVLRPILATLCEQSQYVVIDTPPALSVPDVTEIAQLVDLVLIVVRHGRVSRRTLNALTRLQRNWPDVQLAAVLVGTPRHEESYAY